MKNTKSRHHRPEQRGWTEMLCLGACTCLQLFWAKVVMRKWLNINSKGSDYSADTTDDDDDYSDSNNGEFCEWPKRSKFYKHKDDVHQRACNDELIRLRRRRRNSETFRAQYINREEINICAVTWNVGGKLPPDDLDIEDLLDISNPADIYVIGFQEIIPLNAGNIFGAEDSRPVLMWENIIRENLNKTRSTTTYKYFSDPPSPSKFGPSEDVPNIEDEVVLESDSDIEDEIYPVNEECISCVEVREGPNERKSAFMHAEGRIYGHNTSNVGPDLQDLHKKLSSPKKWEELDGTGKEYCTENQEPLFLQSNRKLTKTLSGAEKIGLSWPEQPLDLLGRLVLDGHDSFKSVKSLKISKSLRKYNSFLLPMTGNNKVQPDASFLKDVDLESLLYRKRRPPFIRIVSKQMVGILLTVWVRRSLRKRIQNLNVSTVGVGAMGYIGNKGSVSVSMSIYQTHFCFICAHLTSGERDADAVKRNVDVHEIHRRTCFNSLSGNEHPETIREHERIIWLGDLNYRLNLSYEKTKELIDKKEWYKLFESDQLMRELRKGRAFDGWSEGTLNFPPTYKYEINSEKYYGENSRTERRTPAWCDRILSFGKGIRLLKYRRAEHKLSDHRPVNASFLVEVEVLSSRKLQKALTFTDAEVEG